MRQDRRKLQRQPVRQTAWLRLADGRLHGCVLADASEAGARVEVENSAVVPDKFILLLSSRGTDQRQCRVVWRKPTELGVKFERRAA